MNFQKLLSEYSSEITTWQCLKKKTKEVFNEKFGKCLIEDLKWMFGETGEMSKCHVFTVLSEYSKKENKDNIIIFINQLVRCCKKYIDMCIVPSKKILESLKQIKKKINIRYFKNTYTESSREIVYKDNVSLMVLPGVQNQKQDQDHTQSKPDTCETLNQSLSNDEFDDIFDAILNSNDGVFQKQSSIQDPFQDTQISTQSSIQDSFQGAMSYFQEAPSQFSIQDPFQDTQISTQSSIQDSFQGAMLSTQDPFQDTQVTAPSLQDPFQDTQISTQSSIQDSFQDTQTATSSQSLQSFFQDAPILRQSRDMFDKTNTVGRHHFQDSLQNTSIQKNIHQEFDIRTAMNILLYNVTAPQGYFKHNYYVSYKNIIVSSLEHVEKSISNGDFKLYKMIISSKSQEFVCNQKKIFSCTLNLN